MDTITFQQPIVFEVQDQKFMQEEKLYFMVPGRHRIHLHKLATGPFYLVGRVDWYHYKIHPIDPKGTLLKVRNG